MQAGKGEIVDEMGLLLEQAGMRDVLPLPKARVPVVKFVVPDTNTKVRLQPGHALSMTPCICFITTVVVHVGAQNWARIHLVGT